MNYYVTILSLFHCIIFGAFIIFVTRGINTPCAGEVDRGHKMGEDTVTFPSKGIL